MSWNHTNRFYLGITLILLGAVAQPTVGDDITTYAGTGSAGYSGDGGSATSAKIDKPWGLTIAASGDIYFADKNNFVVRKIDAATGDISTVAGGGSLTVGDGLLATNAWLHAPQTMAVDGAGNIFIADTLNHRIRKVAAGTGNISTFAGTGVAGYSGDGGAATSAKINLPVGLIFDSAGNLIFADSKNHRIRMITPGGTISTVAGTGTGGYSGNGGLATAADIKTPNAVAVDSADNVYFTDTGNNRIRTFAVGGTISNVAGTGTAGYSGDGGLALSAQLRAPKGLWVVGNGVVNTTGNFGFSTISGYGFTSIFSLTQNNVRRKQIATQITLATDQTINGISAYVGGINRKVRYAIYTDSAGEPDTLLAETSNVNTNNTSDWVMIDLPPTALTAGAYWLALAFEDNNHEYRYEATGGETRYVDRDAAINGYLGTWGASSATYTRKISIYALTASTQNNVAQKQIAVQVTLPEDGTITSITALVGSMDRKARYAIYTDSAGEPDTLLAETDTVVTPKDFNQWVTIDLPAVALTAGTYWLALSFENNAHEYLYESTGGQSRYRNNNAVGNGYLGAWGTSDSTYTRQIYIYADYFTPPTQANDIYVADTDNHRIRKFTDFGTITTIAGNGSGGYGGDGGPATSAQINKPEGLMLNAAGDIFVADTLNHRIRKIDVGPNTISTYGGTGTIGYSGDGGPATSAAVNTPRGVFVDASGDLYLADTNNHVIRKIDSGTGVITLVAGTPGDYGIGDGSLATNAFLDMPDDVAIDAAGNLFIACSQQFRIRRVDVGTGIITTIIGSGSEFEPVDPNADVMLLKPTGVAVDSAGNVYAADSDKLNSRIVKYTVGTATYATVAGTGNNGFSGDGGSAMAAKLNEPADVDVDTAGNLYIADKKNNRIRKVTAATGIIDTLAGTGSGGYSGDGGAATAAQLNQPLGVSADIIGNLYFADSKNHVIRKVASDGIITTVAGTGVSGYSGDGGDATLARLNTPSGVVIDAVNDVYLTDTNNHRVRVIDQPEGESHHWHLNETSGAVAADSIGSSDGTLTNFPVDDSQWSCLNGGSLIFDGVDDYVWLPNESDYDFTDSVTVAAWIKVTSFTVAEQAIVTKGDTAYRLERNGSTNTLQFSVDGLTTNTVVQGSVSVNDGTWHHVAGVYDGSELLLYIDGVQDNAVAATGTMAMNNSAVYFGDNADVGGRYFNGQLDEVFIYETALSASQIQSLAQASLLGWWKLDETSGTTAYDSSAYGYNGTLQNMAGTEWTTGKDDGGLDFSGTNDFIETNVASDLATSITMMTWFKSDDAGSIGNDRVAQRFITQRTGATKSRLALGINNDRVAVYWDDGNNVVKEATTTVVSAGWYHAAITYDGTTVRLYINGVEDGNWPESNMKAPSTDTYQIGCEFNGTREFDGVLDDVRLHRLALCAAEIAAIYQQMAGVRIVNWQEVEP